jgi:hypothetical protein
MHHARYRGRLMCEYVRRRHIQSDELMSGNLRMRIDTGEHLRAVSEILIFEMIDGFAIEFLRRLNVLCRVLGECRLPEFDQRMQLSQFVNGCAQL